MDIYDHVDFRRYLSEWFHQKKSSNPRISHRWFARKLGTSDPSALANILSGRRSVSPERVDKLVEVLGLDDDEAQYFRLLVALSQVTDADERQRLLARLRALRGAARPSLDAEYLEVMSSVGYMALRELARCGPIADAPDVVGARFDPPLDGPRVEELLARMERLGLMTRGPDGWVSRDPAVQTSVTVPLLGSLQYHAEADALARRALERMPGNDRVTSFTGHTLSVPRSRLGELRTLLWEAFHQVAIAADGYPDPDCVVQVNVRMFPLTDLADGG